MNFDIGFMISRDGLDIVNKMKQSTTFSSVFGTRILQNGEEVVLFNPKGVFASCSYEHLESGDMKDLIFSITKNPDVSPGIMASACLDNLKELNLDSDATRSYLAMYFYYDFIPMSNV